MKGTSCNALRARAACLSIMSVMSLIASAPSQANNGSGLQATEAASRFGTAVWLTDQCPSQTQSESAALLAPLVTIGAEFIMGRMTSVLKARTEGLTGQFIARGGSVHGLQLSGARDARAGCLVIGRGLLGSGAYQGKSKGTQVGGLAAAHLNNLGFVDYPAFYVEFGIEQAAVGDAVNVMLKPVFVSYGATSAPNAGTKQKEVAVVIALSSATLEDSAAFEGDKPLAVFRHDLGKLKVGKYYKAGALAGTGAAQSVPAKNLLTSINVAALVTESEDPSVTMQALATAFDSHKSDLQSAVESALGKLVGLPEKAAKSDGGDSKPARGGSATE